ncbi:sodium-dependent transporter [bacterium D16-51]|nr:sodium-dependent transporter [bacterium D16-59]RKI56669.1 sodium-dependent transporter [bacterium D16-51]
MKEKRSSFTGSIGFVMAAAASAVGLGNLWRFPYLAAQHGGGIFILVYLALALTFGFTLLITEIAVGRKTKLSSILAYKKLNKKFGFLGYLAYFVPLIILPYYCVIGGWVLKYMIVFITGQGKVAAGDSYFGDYIGGTVSPLIFFMIFLLATMLVIICGVQKGIERVSKFLMPILLVLAVGVCIYVVTIPNSGDGIKYYLLPDFSKFSFKTICAAMGQLFFSMSLAMGIMVSYGSYVKDDVNIGSAVNQIEIFDTLIAFLAGFMIVPAVYVFSGEAGLATGGPGLMFMTLPKVFASMPMGNLIGACFFILVFVAALTSSISVMEATVSMAIDRFKVSRKLAAAVIFIFSVLLGIPSSLGNGVWADIKLLGMDFLTFFDFLTNSIIMPIVALGTCILIGWFCGTKTVEDEVTKNGEKFSRRGIFRVMIKYIAPVFMIIILVFYTLAQFGIISY